MFKAGSKPNLDNSSKPPQRVQGKDFDEAHHGWGCLVSTVNTGMALFCRRCCMGDLEAVVAAREI